MSDMKEQNNTFKEEELSVPTAPIETVVSEVSDNTVAVRLKIHGICVEIANSASQVIIQNTLSALQNLC